MNNVLYLYQQNEIINLKNKTMKAQTYKIGIYNNGQQIANEVFASNDINEIKAEFKRMFEATIEECLDEGIDYDWAEGTLDGVTFEDAWERKIFSEDTTNVAIFEVEEDELLHTNYTYQGCTSKIML